MKTATLAEQFADLIAGKYTGQPKIIWQQLERSWCNSMPDDQIDIAIEERSDGGCLHDDLMEATEKKDHVRMLVLADQAEEACIDPELCELTRKAIHVQYPR
jgi:hypothetical protein